VRHGAVDFGRGSFWAMAFESLLDGFVGLASPGAADGARQKIRALVFGRGEGVCGGLACWCGANLRRCSFRFLLLNEGWRTILGPESYGRDAMVRRYRDGVCMVSAMS
jgi:hypothetical protein